jgi:hypothetical protein
MSRIAAYSSPFTQLDYGSIRGEITQAYDEGVLRTGLLGLSG